MRFIYYNNDIEDIIRFEGELIEKFTEELDNKKQDGSGGTPVDDKDSFIYVVYPIEPREAWWKTWRVGISIGIGLVIWELCF